MDLLRFPQEGYFDALVKLYREKYAGGRFDLIIATLGPSLDFLAKFDRELFSETPVLFVEVDTGMAEDSPLGDRCAVVTGRLDFEGTLGLALGLHPEVRDVFVVSGASSYDRKLEALARRAFPRFTDRVRFHDLCGLAMGELLEKVSKLPERSLLFYVTIYQDGDGKAFLNSRALSLITERASAPLYGASESFVGSGMVGGSVYSFTRLGEQAARSALRLLSGERPEQVVPVEVRADHTVFDWRQLKRWSIHEGRLPRNSVIRHKEFSLWEHYRTQILGIVSVLTLQTVLIWALVSNLRRRRQANRALSESEARLQRAVGEWKTTFDTYPDLIMVLDRDFRVLRANQATLSFFNEVPERVLGRTLNSLVDEWGGSFDGHVLQRSLETGKPVEEEIHDRKTDAWYLVSAAPVLDGQGGGAGFLYSARDLTGRKRAETEARRRMTELAHVTRVATMGELAASVAHEINQPLTAILSNAQAAQRFLAMPGPDLDEIRQILDDIVRDDRRISEVIRRMRALLKNQPVSCERVRLGEVITECIAMVRSAAPLEGLSITAELAREPLILRGDRVQLQQVLFNLMVNAAASMKNTPAPSRKMAISVRSKDDGSVSVSVSDCGSGIDEHNVERLFEPFYTTKPDGMGMGLSISQTIIKAHGGTMGGFNNPEGGATFFFTLPIDAEGASC
jgi:PAS domain S-box-containing protein